MKTIIACTDFSPNALTAVQYAAALAEAAKARLILFHHYDFPVPATDMPSLYPTVFIEGLEVELERKLKEMAEGLMHIHSIKVEYVLRSLTMHNDLELLFNDEQADLVVMGMQGKNGLVNFFSGNVTAATIRRGKLPLLVIPRGVVFHPVKKILFACDDQEIQHAGILNSLRDLAGIFDAYIEVLTLFDLEKTPELTPKNTLSSPKKHLDKLLKNIRHGYSYENESAVGKGILYEAVRSSADLVAMISHHHSFLSTILNQSKTQRIAAEITLPLLVMGERMELVSDSTPVEMADNH